MSALRRAIVVALEALEVGDTEFAAIVLASALEDGPSARPLRCPECELSFQWPGALGEHRRVVHRLEAVAA